ncbi:hypothetical protein [Radiobacillus sp. PE A8.2]|uniref:hypothetical protein n=1 Tax=Radiobacillus sp. PE A8.2 TaxID=3380349 RepID=UPI00388F7E3C
MQREYFCCGCGLFHWLDMYVKNENCRVDRAESQGCPNPKCKRQAPFQSDIQVFAVDTMSYAYFAENHKDFIDKMKWSSQKYAPPKAISIYKKQEIPIKD